jgi:hypothetical protein
MPVGFADALRLAQEEGASSTDTLVGRCRPGPSGSAPDSGELGRLDGGEFQLVDTIAATGGTSLLKVTRPRSSI